MPHILPFPHVIDNSMRVGWTACPQQFFYRYLMNLAPKKPSVHLHAGGAFAAALETARRAYFDQGHSPETALLLGSRALIEQYGDFEPPEGSNKTLERMLGALDFYFEQFPMQDDFLTPFKSGGKSALEFTFSTPLPIAHPITGDPLLYAGRFDMLAQMKDGSLFVEDDKTASQLGASWARQFDLSSQMTGYVWASKQFGFPVAGAIIRGVSILKTKYEKAQAIVYRPQWQIDRWYNQLLRDVEGMVNAWKTSTFSVDLSASCSAYGGCLFHTLCTKERPEEWIEGNYTVVPYNPLHQDE